MQPRTQIEVFIDLATQKKENNQMKFLVIIFIILSTQSCVLVFEKGNKKKGTQKNNERVITKKDNSETHYSFPLLFNYDSSKENTNLDILLGILYEYEKNQSQVKHSFIFFDAKYPVSDNTKNIKMEK